MTRPGLNRDTLVTLAIALALFAGALVVRAQALGSFSWPDELTWLERSAAFVTAVERGTLSETYLSDHPGVVPMWGFGSALYLRARLTGDRTALDGLAAEQYLGDVPSQLATAAWFTVICTSLATVIAFLLLIPLLGRAGAALGGLLILLDPFYLVHSRIVHVDALLTSAMLLATLSLLVYLKRPEQRRYLFLSGSMGGLALLTKTPALFLVPLTALALGMQWLLRREGRYPWGNFGQVVGAFALWVIVGWGTFLLLWPAAWTRPLFLSSRLFRAAEWAGAVSHGSNFFLGKAVADPGLLFYAVVFPFRLSPLLLVLLPLSVVLVVVAWRRRHDIRLPLLALAYIFFFGVMVTLAAKKGDRYLLPVYPTADVLAAWTLMTLVSMAAERSRDRVRTGRIGYGLVVGVVLFSSLLWLPLAPRYGAYFNPLVGGGKTAVRAFAFGQGEGLDLTARYLNEKENSGELLAVSFYPQHLGYHFDGAATSLRRGEWDMTWLFADYVVFYVSQIQRKLPTAALVDFFSAQKPERVVRLGGVDFARIYRSPVLLSGQPPELTGSLEDSNLGEGLGLVGYALSTEQAKPGDEIFATLYWQALVQQGLDYEFHIVLVDDDGKVVWQQTGQPFEGHFPTSWWPPGRTMYDRYRLALPADLALGRYHLLVGAQEPDSGQILHPTGPSFDLWPGHLSVGVIEVIH
ncbi:glycosyltransferase family 39 protein [Chloroflexota bacterium]